jgi:hypothetical protein
MKTQKLLLPLALLLFLCISQTSDARSLTLKGVHKCISLNKMSLVAPRLTDVDMYILLPAYSERLQYWNFWTVTFVDESTNDTYSFDTDNSTYDSNVLGTLPAGTYTVTFQLDQGTEQDWDDFYVGGEDHNNPGNNRTFYHCVIDSDNNLVIIDVPPTGN